MKARSALLAIPLLLSCTNLTETTNAVVQLQVLAPLITLVEVSDTTRVFARALDRAGNEVPAPIEWLSPDTTLSVDSTGLVTSLITGTGRVQARTGTLVSNLINFTLIPRPDTLVLVGEDTLRVLVGQGSSPQLVARLDTFEGGDTLPASAGQIIYQVVDPVFPDPSQRTVEFSGQVLIDTATTGSNGLPTIPVLLNRVAGTTTPDSAIVEIRAFRFQGTDSVPGSGQRFIIRFDNQ